VRRAALALAAASALALPAQAAADDRVIAPGVTAGGVPVGGQTIDQATATITLATADALARPAVVRSGGRLHTLTPEEAQSRLDAGRTARRAYYAGRDQGPNAQVPLALSHSRAAVAAFTRRVEGSIARRPRNASVRITVRRMVIRRERDGRGINEHELARRIDRAFGDLTRRREFLARVRPDRPAVTVAGLRRQYGTVLTVDRTTFRLRLFKRLRLVRTYRIAVGRAGNGTPPGLFRIQSRQVNPAWHVPNSAWAGSLAGQVIPGGAPNNPLRARWLGVNGSVGIHGTSEEWSIGSRASRGCIRMRVRDVVELYPRVPLGARVLIR
jgi:hypothetical protein